MIRRLVTPVLLVALLLMVWGTIWIADPWSWRSETFTFTNLQRADAITLRTANQNPIMITDAESVQAIARFAQDHSDQWVIPWYGVPVGRVHVEFLGQGRPLGELGVGRGFLTTQQKGGFYSRSITTNDQDRLVGLLRLTPQDLG